MLINDSQIYVGGLKNGKFHGEGLWYILKDENEFNEGKFMFGEWEEHKLKVDYKKDIKKCEFDVDGNITDDFCFLVILLSSFTTLIVFTSTLTSII